MFVVMVSKTQKTMDVKIELSNASSRISRESKSVLVDLSDLEQVMQSNLRTYACIQNVQLCVRMHGLQV